MAPKQTPLSAQDQQEKQPFRFMDLPPELRLRVYENLFEVQQGILLVGRFTWSVFLAGGSGIILTPGLLTTCKLIHKEATLVLYANNTFRARYPDVVFAKFQAKIQGSWKFLRALKMETFPRSKEKFHSLLQKLKEAKHLESLVITDCYWLETSSNVLAKYPTPKAFAKEVGPFVRELHKWQKKDQEHGSRNVVDVLQFRLSDNAAQAVASFGGDINVVKQNQEKYEDDVKAILAKTLK